MAGPPHVTNGDAPVPDIAGATGVAPGDVLVWRDVLTTVRSPPGSTRTSWRVCAHVTSRTGGVHLAPGHPHWAYDATAREPVRLA